ncbi:fimbria/pilus outer membrane usher protein, partial [Gallibacterium anatis]
MCTTVCNAISSKKYPYKQSFKLNALSLALLGCFLHSSVEAVEFAEFYDGFLRGKTVKETVDISRFNYGNPIPAGEYLSDIYLNQEFKGRLKLQFIEVPEKDNTALCADDTLLEMLDLTDDAIARTRNEHNGCILFDNIAPEIKTDFNLNDLQLDVKSPQAFIKQRPLGYISPAQWQVGVPVAFIRYDASNYRYKYADINSQQSYLGINAGINFAGWALRHQGSISWQNNQRLPYQNTATYLQRDIAVLRGQLKIGDFNTDGVLMDSFSLRGVQLSSDDRMLATSVQGYAPIIRGIANSNARVTVRQNGSILREVTVPAGPFSINDLYPMGYGGDLQVEILEANGEKRTFS